MRKFLIGAVVALGVAGLGFWAVQNNARKMHDAINTQAQTAIAGAVHGVQAEVTGRDIRISGMADSDAERDALISTLNEIDGLGEVTDALDVLPVAKPFTIAATRKSGQTLLQGNVPTEDMRAALQQSGVAGAESLVLASGAPERWESAIGAGLGALAKMEDGSVSLNGTEMRLTGIVDFPSDRETLIAALSLPTGFSLQNDIETRDDGQPIAFEIGFDAETGVTVAGKLPNGLDKAQVGEALGVATIAGDVTSGLKGESGPLLEILAKLGPRLSGFETATLRTEGDALTLNGVTNAGVNTADVQERMSAEFGDSVEVALTASSVVLDFRPSLQTCTAQTDRLQSSVKISFLSGSPNLAPESLGGIDALAQIMGRCVREAGLTAELGGHTDNRGSGNYELSAARAEVVRAAMIARGVPGEALSAVGFGPSKPIADNASEEGRATNRRITVSWSP